MTVNILLVEDDDVAVEAVMRSMSKSEISFPVIHAEDGKAALEILQGRHPSKTLRDPFIILLDLNMPRMNGFEFLEAIRADKKLKSAVVFVLTTSSSDTDRTKAYNENIAGYMVKDKVGPQFSKLFNLLNNYGGTVSLPNIIN